VGEFPVRFPVSCSEKGIDPTRWRQPSDETLLPLRFTLRPSREAKEAKRVAYPSVRASRHRVSGGSGLDQAVVSMAEPVAAVSGAGGLGSIGNSLRSAEDVREQTLGRREPDVPSR
jgi:hypothetical protein